MPNEFDEISLPCNGGRGSTGAAAGGAVARDSVPRLIARIYHVSDEPRRAHLLNCLLRPLGPLGLVAISAGAFAGFLQRRSPEGFRVSTEDVSRYTTDQIAELVRFVAQVSPEALQLVADSLADRPAVITAFGAAAVTLLLRALRPPEARRS
jgi:hypothetical protein